MLNPSEQARMIQLLKHLQVERGMVVEETLGSEILVSPGNDVTGAACRPGA